MLDLKTSPDVPDLVPARMLNEFTYCPRLVYLELRRLQFRAADDAARSLALAKKFVIAKVFNARTLLRRNGEDVPAQAIDMMRALADEAATCTAAASLLGIEGTARGSIFRTSLACSSGAMTKAVD